MTSGTSLWHRSGAYPSSFGMWPRSALGHGLDTVGSPTKAKVDEINRVLPADVSIVPFYDRTELVNRAIWTVEKALLEGAVLVVAVLILFLGKLRSAGIVSLM